MILIEILLLLRLLLISAVLLILKGNEHVLIFDEAPIPNLKARQVE